MIDYKEYTVEELHDRIAEELEDAPDDTTYLGTALGDKDRPIMVIGIKSEGEVISSIVEITDDFLKTICENLGYRLEKIQ